MGRFERAVAATGLDLPASGRRTAREAVPGLLDACESDDARVRQLALRHLCTCHIQGDDDSAWATILRMFDDESVSVRAEALHSLTDSTPVTRVQDVVAVLEARFNEPDPKLRRRIRKTLTHYRRTGKLTDAPK